MACIWPVPNGGRLRRRRPCCPNALGSARHTDGVAGRRWARRAALGPRPTMWGLPAEWRALRAMPQLAHAGRAAIRAGQNRAKSARLHQEWALATRQPVAV